MKTRRATSNGNTAAPVVVITGAAGGLGKALAVEFSRQSWRVAAVCHEKALPPNLAVAKSVLMDVSDGRRVRAGMKKILTALGRIDALVNNAGLVLDDLLPNLSEAAWDRVLDTNLRGAFLCSQAVVPAMVAQREGCIINIASFSGRTGTAGQANYAASKAGLFGLTHALATELGDPRNGGIRVNAVLPGFIETPMTQPTTATRRQAVVKANVLRRLNSLNEVARFIVFLAGMRNVSGQIFQLDSRIASWT